MGSANAELEPTQSITDQVRRELYVLSVMVFGGLSKNVGQMCEDLTDFFLFY